MVDNKRNVVDYISWLAYEIIVTAKKIVIILSHLSTNFMHKCIYHIWDNIVILTLNSISVLIIEAKFL